MQSKYSEVIRKYLNQPLFKNEKLYGYETLTFTDECFIEILGEGNEVPLCSKLGSLTWFRKQSRHISFEDCLKLHAVSRHVQAAVYMRVIRQATGLVLGAEGYFVDNKPGWCNQTAGR